MALLMISLGLGLACSMQGLAVAQVAAPAFDVATVKPAGTDTGSSGIHTGHGQVNAQGVTIKQCLMGAYGVGPHEIDGGPSWLATERFDILAKGDPSINSDDTLMLMLRDLLADRFKLTVHKETKTMQAYLIEVAKGGAKLEKSDDGDASTSTNSDPTGITIDARHQTVAAFARRLSRRLDLPVVNATALEGTYNMKLHWTPEDRHVEGRDEVSIYTAMEEQLGLKLRAAKVPVEVIVVDHVEPPSAN